MTEIDRVISFKMLPAGVHGELADMEKIDFINPTHNSDTSGLVYLVLVISGKQEILSVSG